MNRTWTIIKIDGSPKIEEILIYPQFLKLAEQPKLTSFHEINN